MTTRRRYGAGSRSLHDGWALLQVLSVPNRNLVRKREEIQSTTAPGRAAPQTRRQKAVPFNASPVTVAGKVIFDTCSSGARSEESNDVLPASNESGPKERD